MICLMQYVHARDHTMSSEIACSVDRDTDCSIVVDGLLRKEVCIPTYNAVNTAAR